MSRFETWAWGNSENGLFQLNYLQKSLQISHKEFSSRYGQFQEDPTIIIRLLDYCKDLVLSTSVAREARVLSAICGYNSLTYHNAMS